jgi:transcriptional regulator with XRE-family HTH domain
MQTKVIAAYFRELRKGYRFTQQSLADAAGVSKRTVERLEGGDRPVSIESLERIMAIVGASPDEVNYLATNPSATPSEASELAQLLLQRNPRWSAKVGQLHIPDPHLLGIQTYVQLVRKGRQITRKDLADLLGIGIATLANWEDGRSDTLPFPIVVRAIKHINGSFEDLEHIGEAVDGHVALGRRLAEARVAIQTQHSDQVSKHGAYAALTQEGTMMERIAAIESVIQFILSLLKRVLPDEAPDIERIATQWFQRATAADEVETGMAHNGR